MRIPASSWKSAIVLHVYIMTTLSKLLWQLATGLPWNLGRRALLKFQRCMVATQVYAALRFLIRHSHSMWDVSEEDIMMDLRTSHMTFLVVFCSQSEFSGCLHTLLLMVEILHYLKDPKLWEFWHIPYSGVLQDFISSTVPPELRPRRLPAGCKQLCIGISD